MKKIIILSFILTVVVISVQAQRHGGGRGGYRGGYSHGGGYGYRGGGYGYSYGRPYVGFGLGLALGAYINPYYGYGYPPYAYGYPYASSPYGYPYPPAYAQPPQYPQQYQYNNPPQSYDSTGRAPQPGNPGNNNNDGGYQAPPQSANGDVADNGQGPKPQKIWVASHWTHRADGWVWVEGYWK